MSDLRDKMARSITLNIPETSINEEFVKRLSDISKAHNGKCQLMLNLIDKKNKDIIKKLKN